MTSENGEVDGISVINICDTEELSYQVAGHIGTTTGALLKQKLHEGFIMKPVQKGELGKREVEFYRNIKSGKWDGEIGCLLKLLTPEFRGLASVASVGEKQEVVKTDYLILKDIAHGFELPCLVDIKMGKQTWDPTASEEKMKKEQSKYTGTRSTLGVSIPGIQYYNILSPEVPTKSCKEFGRSLDRASLFKAFQNFLNKDSNVEKLIAKAILHKLKRFRRFFGLQYQIAFYASSLLIAYDAKFVETNLTKLGEMGDSDSLCLETDDWLRIYMIDFTHVFPNDGQPDKNYIFALDNVMDLFSAIVDGKSNF